MIGYYNGSDCSYLEDDNSPNKETKIHSSLLDLEKLLKAGTINFNTKIELRPNQITIEVNNVKRWGFVKSLIIQIVKTSDIQDVQILESSHSIDIIPTSISKSSISQYPHPLIRN